MEDIKMETVTTPATNFCTTENQNPPVLLENELENLNLTAILENQSSPAILENQQYNYAAAASSSKVILANSDIDAYLQSFPPGYRFKPTDEELIVDYLLRKIQNKQPHPSRIHDADIYRESPFYLSANYAAANENEWYFLSPREKKYLNGIRPNRAAGNGTWKATGADKTIKSSTNKVDVGFVKTLKYHLKGSSEKEAKTNWIMKEYRVKKSLPSAHSTEGKRSKLAKSSKKSMKLDDYVLYKIYKYKSNKSNATNVEEGEANDQDHAPFDYSANQQQQQQQWPITNPNYLGYNNHVFPNDVSMVIPQMHGNGFYDQNRKLMPSGTLYNQQTLSVYDYIPPPAMLPADACNNVRALNYVQNISEELSPAMPSVDASNYAQAFNNEMKTPQMQHRQYQHQPVMTRPYPSSSYHPYHHPDHPQN